MKNKFVRISWSHYSTHKKPLLAHMIRKANPLLVSSDTIVQMRKYSNRRKYMENICKGRHEALWTFPHSMTLALTFDY